LANIWLFTFSLPWTIGILSIIGGIVALVGAFRQKRDEETAPAAAPAAMATRAAPVDIGETVEEAPEIVEQVEIPEPTTPEEMAKFSYDLEYIEGIGQVYGQQLKAIGIGTPLVLLRQGATRKGRAELAEKTEISPKLILSWVNFVDLFRIKGVGSEYADLLEKAGVDTVPELAQRNAQNLLQKVEQVNQEKHLVRRVPDLAQIEDWIAQARQLPRVVTY
jgi:predicted flap endonuclease-1-like 5' DNA nuclease